ncbi:uroporphyrinogen decarboxylase [Candidatus Spongiihabitans sp.]|uniref:uroporphyrinogen decarboxylase n=1 Tax=Candidatus Spongiihabitans sp. TaxID=3101308 RepID=UPI003C6F5BCA
MHIMNDRFLKALQRQPVDCTPVWIMRQAGRYLPEYRQTRAKAGDFLTLCKTPELACEVTLQPIRRFELDAAILFSDILTIPDAFGLGLSINEGVGPKFERPLRNKGDVERLPEIDIDAQLGYVMEAIRLTRIALANKTPLIGFSGSPWTLATYMVEGGGSKEYRYVKGMMHDQPAVAHKLLSKITEAVIGCLKGQANAGAQALMVFDTWGGVLTTPDYDNFSLDYMAQIVSAIKSDPNTVDIPITLFTKGGGHWLEKIADSGCDAIGLDWTMSMSAARQRVGQRVALQGNMDPTVLYASSEKVEQEAKRVLDDFGGGDGHIFNLGHGIHPTINPDRVATLVNTVHRESKRT